MSLIVNHLKNADTAALFLEVAYGRHIVKGDLEKSLDTQGSPKDIYVQHKFGKGEWEGFVSAYWRGFSIPMTDFIFHPGKLSSGNSDSVQGVDAVFDKDIPHSLTTWGSIKLPHDEIQDFDTTKETPDGFYGIAKTKKCNIFNSSGVVTDFIYSESAADQLLDMYLYEGKRSASRIDFGNIGEWRSFMAEQILCDYRTLPIAGFGLNARYYNGANFNTFVSERVDPVTEFLLSDGTPAYQLEDAFSVRWEGYLKPQYSENFTFTLRHDDIGRLWIDDVQIINGTSDGTTTAVIALTAGQFHKIKIEWADSVGLAEVRLEWESASQPRETIPPSVLFPKEKYVDRYQSHLKYTQPTRLDEAVKSLLAQTNSTMQRVNGKYRFFCYEMLTGSNFTFDEGSNFYPETVDIQLADPTSLRNVWGSGFIDIDSRFFDGCVNPPFIEFEDLISAAGRRIDGEALNFQSTTRFQAWRLLQAKASRIARAPARIKFTGNCETYPVLKSDRVIFNNEFNDVVGFDARVAMTSDDKSGATADDREFELVKWV